MDLHVDFKELLECFNARKVEYVVVGGYAMAAHGAPRYTGDLDVFVRPTRENAERVLLALADFGFGALDLTPKDFDHPGGIVQLGFEPWRIDLITRIAALSWEEASASAVVVDWGVPVRVIGRTALIANKRATGRGKDASDADRLEGRE